MIRDALLGVYPSLSCTNFFPCIHAILVILSSRLSVLFAVWIALISALLLVPFPYSTRSPIGTLRTSIRNYSCLKYALSSLSSSTLRRALFFSGYKVKITRISPLLSSFTSATPSFSTRLSYTVISTVLGLFTRSREVS